MKKLTIFLAFLLFVGFQATAQMQITGTVTGAEDGLSIPGVSVTVKGNTAIGVTTDIDGKYSLTVPGSANALIFSFVGMVTMDVEINNRSIIDVVMQSDILEMDEVIVTAYGTSKKSSFTGSASTIDAEKLQKLSTPSVGDALQGNAPGVMVISQIGQPGENAEIRIRGIGSISASSEPLIVLDGVPYSGNLNTINAADIDNMSILKDASATALYGSRGANGVIMITTKRGSKGAAKVNLRALYGVTSRAVKEYDKVGAAEYYTTAWESLRFGAANKTTPEANPGQWATDNLLVYTVYNAYSVNNPIGPDGNLVSGAELLWDTDWMDEIVSNGNLTDIQLDVSGGDETTNYFLSIGYNDTEGIVPVSDFKRYSARLNLDKTVNDWFKTGINFFGSTSDQNYPTGEGSSYSNNIQFGRNMAPIYPVYLRNTDGTFITDGDGNKIYDYGTASDQDGRGDRPTDAYPNTNVLGTALLDDYLTQRDNVSTRMYGELQLLPGLSFRSNFSYDYYVLSRHRYNNPYYGYATSYGGISTKRRTRQVTYTFNNLLTYDKTFGDHHFNLLAGHEAYNMHLDFLEAGKKTFPFGGLDELDAAAVVDHANSYEHNHRIQSYLSRLNYDFLGKYYFSASYRRDGSSRFAKDYRWGNFWSVGGSWRVSEEDFLNLDWMHNLKLKASYGTLGNEGLLSGNPLDGIPLYYAYQGLYQTGFDNLGDPGLLVNTLATPEISWETSKTFNIGLEIGLLNKINLEIEYYQKNVEDMLFQRPLAASTGVDFVNENIGDMKNTGLDILLNATIMNRKDFTWYIDLNFSTFKNEVTSMPFDEQIVGNKKLQVGHSVYDYFMQDFAGVDPLTGSSLWYKDILELDEFDNVIYDAEGKPTVTGKETTDVYSQATRYYVGSSLPDWYGGFTNTINYKGFDFSFFISYRVGGKLYDSDYQSLMHAGTRIGQNWSTEIRDAWTPDNTITDVPALDYLASNGNSTSSRFLVDASYARLRNVTLGYTLPDNLVSKIKIDNARVFISGDNLYTLFKHKGMDPEVGFTGNTNQRYPQQKVFSVGLNLSF